MKNSIKSIELNVGTGKSWTENIDHSEIRKECVFEK